MITMLQVTEPGDVQKLSVVNDYINKLKLEWDEFKAGLKSRVNSIHITQFLLRSLDGLILFVESLIGDGADKKATVLSAVAVLYDYIIKESFPLWLKPYAFGIKGFIVYTIVSIAIDWIVSKYNSGDWRRDVKTEA